MTKTDIKKMKKIVVESDQILSGIVQFVDNTNSTFLKSDFGVMPMRLSTKEQPALTGVQIINSTIVSPKKNCALFFDDFTENLGKVGRNLALY